MCKTEADTYQCDCNIIHEKVVETVRQVMPEEEKFIDLADTFKIFSDSTRIKILYALMQAEMCVCDISALIGMTKSSVSHQLRILKQAKLVKYRKDGRIVYYSIADEHVRSIFNEGMMHILEQEI